MYTFDDLTEIRRLEREVRMQDRLAAVGRLAAAIAHEIRNPLTSIAGSVSMLSGIPDLSEEHRQLLQIVTRESERLNGIITDFLAYSRGKQYQFTKVDLVPLLEDTLTLLEHRLAAQEYGHPRRTAIQRATSLALWLTETRSNRSFGIFAKTRCAPCRRAELLLSRWSTSGRRLADQFRRHRSGNEPQLMEKVFEPFQSQFEGGTGLGLAIVYQIVQAHEGKVWARSKPGEGSVFVLRLRRFAAEQVRNPRISSVGQPLSSPNTAMKSSAAAAAAGGRAHG